MTKENRSHRLMEGSDQTENNRSHRPAEGVDETETSIWEMGTYFTDFQ